MAIYRDACQILYDQLMLCLNDSDAEPVLAAFREDFPGLLSGLVTPVSPPKQPIRSKLMMKIKLLGCCGWE